MAARMEHQIVVRVSDALHAALVADAAESGRTLAQSVRFILRRSLRVTEATAPSRAPSEEPR